METKNPADHTSRGLTARSISNSNWLTGPQFLWRVLPDKETVPDVIAIDDPEVKKIIVHRVTRSNFSMLSRLEYFYDWTRALKDINALRRIILRKHPDTQNNDVEQLVDTEAFIIKTCQMEQFPEEISTLRNKDTAANKMLSLDPFLDEDMILRVVGHLKRSTMNYYEKYPLLLPKDGQLTHLIVKQCHEMTEHQGRGGDTFNVDTI